MLIKFTLLVLGWNDIQSLDSEDVIINMHKFNEVVERLSELQRMAVALKVESNTYESRLKISWESSFDREVAVFLFISAS